jgi:hypothetical protein
VVGPLELVVEFELLERQKSKAVGLESEEVIVVLELEKLKMVAMVAVVLE